MPDILRDRKTTIAGGIVLILGIGFLMGLVTFEQFVGVALPILGGGLLLASDSKKS